MTTSAESFWQLLGQSQLIGTDELPRCRSRFQTDRPDATTGGEIAHWLQKQNLLTVYQTKILLAGRSGPFFYGDYKVVDRLQEGPFTGCFRALHIHSGHPVLLRFVSEQDVQSHGSWDALAARVQAACRLVHSGLQRYFELVDVGTYRFVVGEDLSGQTLSEQLAASGPISQGKACFLIGKAAQPLGYLHQQGLAHGDVRPPHLLLEGRDQIVLLRDPLRVVSDLDSRFAQEDPDLLERFDYAAPEQFQNDPQATARTDVYGLGCTLHTLLTGQPPFAGGTAGQKTQKHLAEPVAALDEQGVSARVFKLLSFMMAKNPEMRYADGTAVLQEVTTLLTAEKMQRPPRPEPPTLEAYLALIRQPAESVTPAVPITAARTDDSASAQTSASELPVPEIQIAPQSTAPGVDLQIAGTSTTSSRLRQGRTRNKRQTWLIVSLASLAAVAVGSVLIYPLIFGGASPEAADAEDRRPKTKKPTPQAPTSDEDDIAPSVPITEDGENGASTTAFGQRIVNDNGSLLWASPTQGQPIDLALTPPGSQFFVAARPARLVSLAEGNRVLEALGPEFADLRQKFEQAAGFSLNQIDSAVITLHGAHDGPLRASIVVRPVEQLDKVQIVASWSGAQVAMIDDQPAYYEAGGWSYFVPEEGGAFAMGNAEEIRGVAEFSGAAPIHRHIDRLRVFSDNDRHVTVFFTPYSISTELLREGRTFFFGPTRKLREPLDWFIDSATAASSASLHFAEQTFLEIRSASNLEKDHFKMAEDLRGRIREMPPQIEQYLFRVYPHPYWRQVALRVSPMIQFAAGQTRIGVEADQPVVNCVLPENAGHNLLFSALMLLLSEPDSTSVATVNTTPAGPGDLEELLSDKMSLKFDQKSLEFSISDLEAEVLDRYPSLSFGFKLRIIGADLEKEGLTRNVQVRNIDLAEATLADMLTTIVTRATGDKSPSDPEQMLIWAIGPDPEQPAQQIILITTRTAAAANGYQVPAAFQ